MTHYYALLSIVFMMSFVALFDCRHVDGQISRFCKHGLLSTEEVDLLRSIMSACQE
jgi:hypothetical protein